MNRKLLLGSIIAIVIMGVVGLSNVSANPFLAPPPPGTSTPDSSGLQRNFEGALDSGPMPTEKKNPRKNKTNLINP